MATAHRVWGDGRTGALLLPTSIGRLVSALARRRVDDGVRAILGLALGLIAAFAMLLSATAAVRGLLFGLLDQAPYDISWGGPTLVGAWAVHLLGGVATIPIALLILSGLAALDRANNSELTEQSRRRWPLPVSALLTVAAVFLVISWVHQLN